MRSRYTTITVFAVLLVFLLCSTASAFSFNKFGRGIKGSRDMETRELDLDSFNEIVLGGSMDLEISIGSRQHVEVTIDDNLWDILIAEVDRGVLTIEWDESCRPSGRCHMVIVVPDLDEVTINGAGDVGITEYEGESFVFNLRGAGDLDMEGQVDELEVILSGAGSIDTRELKAEDVEVRINGAGNASVYCTGHLDARISGVGNLKYYGDPESKRTRVSGIGRISGR